MKKMILFAAILLSTAAVSSVSAQGKVVNISSQPKWGPAGHDYVDYYYLPDIETYYHVPSRQFIYSSEGKWIHASDLPPGNRKYNLNSGRKVVINQPNAYHHHKAHKVKYAKQKSNNGQGVVKPRNNKAKTQVIGNGHEKANGKGHQKGKH